jgi:hypothetical protein
LSEHNPFDDEEIFTEQINENTLPDEEDVSKPGINKDTVLHDIIKQINQHFDRSQLTEIILGFEYVDTEGFTSWVTTHYIRKD